MAVRWRSISAQSIRAAISSKEPDRRLWGGSILSRSCPIRRRAMIRSHAGEGQGITDATIHQCLPRTDLIMHEVRAGVFHAPALPMFANRLDLPITVKIVLNSLSHECLHSGVLIARKFLQFLLLLGSHAYDDL